MSVSTSWIHGNALTIESPVDYAPNGQERARLILTPTGPGAWVSCESGGMISWLHLPIPTVNVSISQLELVRVFLLFHTWNSSIQNVHVYDGYQKMEEFNGAGGQGLGREGNFLVKGPGNTFNLQKPLPVKRGIGL